MRITTAMDYFHIANKLLFEVTNYKDKDILKDIR